MLEISLCFMNTIDVFFFFLIFAEFLFLSLRKLILLMFLGFTDFFSTFNFDGDF